MDFSDYDIGYRQGVFDKCNGESRMLSTGIETDRIWFDGYDDGYDGNDVKISQPKPDAPDSDFGAIVVQRFFKLWCEWDYGQEGFVFDTEQGALDWLQRTATDIDDGAEGAMSAQEMFDEGLAGLDIVTLIP